MSELLSYYRLCPVTSDVLGVSEDAEKTSVICTLGQKIVFLMQVSEIWCDRKQLSSDFLLAQPPEAVEVVEHIGSIYKQGCLRFRAEAICRSLLEDVLAVLGEER